MIKKKFYILFSVVFTLFCLLGLFGVSFCYEPVQVVNITKEDIQNARPTTPDVYLTPKELKIVEMMERRHFLNTYPDLSAKERLKNLEYELLGRCWQYTDKETRLKTLKLASSNIMLQGTSLPASISSKRNAKRMTNDAIKMRKKDDVGLIDGMLRLISPETYRQYRSYSDKMYNDYEY